MGCVGVGGAQSKKHFLKQAFYSLGASPFQVVALSIGGSVISKPAAGIMPLDKGLNCSNVG